MILYFVTLLFIPTSLVTPPDIDECALSILHNCHDNALCTDTMGSFICVCVDGFRGDGVACVGEWVDVFYGSYNI